MSLINLENLVKTNKLKVEAFDQSEFDALIKYRPDNSRYIVFQVLPHTLNLDSAVWRVLDKCHYMRNVAEYEGYLEIDDQLLKDLIDAAQAVYGEIKGKRSAKHL